jgi:hypothetical protein
MLAVSITAACGGSEALDTGGAGPGEAFDLKGVSVIAAGAGSDLVIVDVTEFEDAGERRALVRSGDGTLRPLPPIPLAGNVAIASVGDTVAVGGAECADRECRRVRPAVVLLESDEEVAAARLP